MKIRLGFVSNSSSSSFVVTDHSHPAIEQMKLAIENGLTDFYFSPDFQKVHDNGDNDVWHWCSSNGWDCGEDFLCQYSFSG